MTITLVLFGFIALGNLKVNLLPDLSYPTLTVRTEYTGAAPTEIETLISQPVEEAVGVVKGLRKLKSVSRTGQSDVVLEFAWGTDMDQASLEVRDKMEVVQLPLEAKAPVLLRFNPSTAADPAPRAHREAATAIRMRALTELRRYADDDLKKKLEPVEGVAAVKVGGGLEDEIQVDIDQQKLAQLNLPIDTVIARLQGRRTSTSPAAAWRKARSATSCARSTSSPASTRSATCWSPRKPRAAARRQSAAEQMARVAAATGDASAMAAAASVQSASLVAGHASPAACRCA